MNGFVTYYTATSESLWTAFLIVFRWHSHIPYSSKLLCKFTALQAQNRSGLHFCTFIIVRPLSHTRSSKLLCNLLHCELRIALDCIFALLSSSDHSHTPDLVNYYATYCTASSESNSGLHFCTFIIFRPLSHTRSSKLLCNLLHCELRMDLDCIFAPLSAQTTLTHQI